MSQNKEIENIRFLKGISNQPEVFLSAQNILLYNDGLSRFHSINNTINPAGLPSTTEDFYLHSQKPYTSPLTNKIPRILNIGSGPEASRKLNAINTDISKEGKPDVIADAHYLPFKDGVFSIVRASHVLEHIEQAQIEPILKEWKRVLHVNGELQIAVPDADITFQEILDGKTPKEQDSFSYEYSTAPLTQIYGLGYENPETNTRWLHRIIFSQALAEQYIRRAGFNSVNRRTKTLDLAAFSKIDDDSQNHYSLLLSARNERSPHHLEVALSEREFRNKCYMFKEADKPNPNTTIIIPVRNESKNIPHFLSFLENSANLTDTNREFIFVVNGSTDRSAEIIKNYIPKSLLNLRLINSDPGILRAFWAGIDSRKYDGFVGKVDADTILHPHSLDLMQMHLVDKPQVQATYAEPTPLDSQFLYNEAEHNPPVRSERLYIHGRASLYKTDPFKQLMDKSVLTELQVEDIFLSFFFTYFYGLDSINRTPNALIYSKTVKNLEDLVRQLSRNASEFERVFKAYPPFQSLNQLLEREIYPSNYKNTVDEANNYTTPHVKEWTTLESTK